MIKESFCLLVYDYHYIGEEDRFPQGIYPISPKRIEQQIDILAKYFRFVGQNELLGFLDRKNNLSGQWAAVTLDDGLRSQYENGLKVFRKRNVPLTFFINTLPYKEEKACLVHKLHWIRAKIPPAKFLALVNKKTKEILGNGIGEMLDDELLKKARDEYRYDDDMSAQIKFILNTRLDPEEKKLITESIFDEIVPNEKEFVRRYYLGIDQLKELSKNHSFGLHTHEHVSLSGLSEEQIEKNLEMNYNIIRELTGQAPKSISYPYGSQHDINQKVLKICSHMGIRFGFTKERAFNLDLDEPLLLARADTNDIPGGKHPVLDDDGHGFMITGNFNQKRTWHCLIK